MKTISVRKRIEEFPCIICKAWPAKVFYLTVPQCGGKEKGDNLITLCTEHRKQMLKSGLAKFIEKNKVFETWLRDHERLDILDRAFKFYNS